MPFPPRTWAVLGSAGQLGSELVARLGTHAHALTRADFDVRDAAAAREVLIRLRPGVVVNCAAYNLVDRAEEEPAQAFAVNAIGPLRLAEICRDLSALLVHFSTDYVFGRVSAPPTPRLESHAPQPACVYAASKLAGEHLALAYAPRCLVIRTCGLYGRRGVGGKGGNFVETVLRLARQGRPVRVVDDQVCTPTYAADLADATLRLIESSAAGLFHLTNAGQCSWYEFAQAIFELAGISVDLTPVSSRDYASKAPRPPYSVLASERPEAPVLRPWRDALADYLSKQ